MATTQVLRSEWTKIRSVASTVWTLSLALVVTVALGMLISALSKNEFDNLSERDRLEFDPTFISFAGMSLGQLAMIVFGVLVVSNEYSTGMIRISLAAVPRRGTFLFSKIAVATALALAVGLATSFLTFFLGQAMLGDHRASIGSRQEASAPWPARPRGRSRARRGRGCPRRASGRTPSPAGRGPPPRRPRRPAGRRPGPACRA